MTAIQRTRRFLKHSVAAIALPILAAAVLIAACSDDRDAQQTAQQAEPQAEQPTVVAQAQQQQAERSQQVEYQQEQQQAMQQQAEQVEQDEEQESYSVATSAASQQDRQEQASAEQAEQQAQQQEAMEEADEDSSDAYPNSGGPYPEDEQQQVTLRPRPGATNFEDYPSLGWRDTDQDDTSTFSLDVDRTSYFLALNWVQNGYAIEPASVRAEEWINAFNYRYDRPDVDDSFAVTTDIVRHPLNDDLHLVRIATQAPEFVDNTPLNVTLVLDSSGSMREGDRVEIARAAAESIRRGLGDDDRIAVVLFSDGIVDHAEHERPGDRGIRRVIDRLTPLNSTNVQAGLNLGVELADDIRRQRPDAHNYVILMSDGVANVDATDPFAILRSAEDRDERNPLRLITVGVGIANYNDVLLEQLAQHGNGWYRYLQDVAQARSTFSRENWLALSIPFADQARAQVRWDEQAVAGWRLVGYENRVTADRNFEQDRQEFAEIPMGSATTMFFEVELTDDAQRRDLLELGEVELRWLTPRSDQSNRQQAEIGGRVHEWGDDALLDLGTVVALAADRYSWFGQDGLGQNTFTTAADELDDLASWFESLPTSILDTQAGRDFAQLLQAMGAVADHHESEDPGYAG